VAPQVNNVAVDLDVQPVAGLQAELPARFASTTTPVVIVSDAL